MESAISSATDYSAWIEIIAKCRWRNGQVSPLTPIENRRFNYRRRLISIDTAIASRHFQNIRFMLNVITRLFNLRPTQLHSLSGCARATYRAECKPRAPSMCAFLPPIFIDSAIRREFVDESQRSNEAYVPQKCKVSGRSDRGTCWKLRRP